MTIAVICIALLGLLLFGLGFFVSVQRGRSDIMTGVSDDPTSLLNKAVRAHGNTAEFAPLLAVLILYLGMSEPGPWVAGVMILAVLSRYLMATGFLVCRTLAEPHPLKVIGALGTYVAGLLLSVAALLNVL